MASGGGRLLSILRTINYRIEAIIRDEHRLADQLDFATRNGSRVRPIALLMACEAVGGDGDQVLDIAVAIELAHKASLIRDDLVDGDLIRKGKETFHSKFGLAQSVAFGDVLLAMSLRLAVSSKESGHLIVRDMVDSFYAMSCGQAMDVMGIEAGGEWGDDYVNINALKSASIFESAFRIGASLGKGSDSEIRQLSKYGHHLGMCFQIWNDIDNMLGDEPGRIAMSDLERRSPDLIIGHAMQVLDPGTRNDLLQAIERLGIDAESARDEVIGILNISGSVEYAVSLAGCHLDMASNNLEGLKEGWALDWLRQISDSGRFQELRDSWRIGGVVVEL